MKVLVIIPAYNEQDSIGKTVCELQDYLTHKDIRPEIEIDYVVINDGSTDNTQEILEREGFNHINLLQNLGIGGAVQTGYRYAHVKGYDAAIQYDGDGQHDPRYISTILAPLQNGAALCIGSRFLDPDSSAFKSTVTRRMGIQIIARTIWMVTKQQVTDPTSGFRAANKEVIAYFCNHYPSEYPEPESIVELLRLGYRVEERPVSMRERSGGSSSIRAFKTVYYMINVCLSIFLTGMKRKRDLL